MGLESSILVFGGPFLLARSKRLFQLSVDKKVAENSRRRPRDSVGPSLDASALLGEDENSSGLDDAGSLSVVRSSRHWHEQAVDGGLEQQQGVVDGAHVAVEGGLDGHCVSEEKGSRGLCSGTVCSIEVDSRSRV